MPVEKKSKNIILDGSQQPFRLRSNLHNTKKRDSHTRGIRYAFLKPMYTALEMAPTNDSFVAPYAERMVEAAVMSVILAVALVGNVSLFIIITTNKSLRVASNILVLCLSSADLLVSALNMPVTVYTLTAGTWAFSAAACTAAGFVAMLTFVASVMSLGTISISRYFMICHPNKYKKLYTPTKTALWIAGTWLLSTLLALPPLGKWWGEYDYLPGQSFCFCKWSKTQSYTIFMVAVCFGGPCTVMTFCYVRILQEVRRSKVKVTSGTAASLATTTNTTAVSSLKKPAPLPQVTTTDMSGVDDTYVKNNGSNSTAHEADTAAAARTDNREHRAAQDPLTVDDEALVSSQDSMLGAAGKNAVYIISPNKLEPSDNNQRTQMHGHNVLLDIANLPDDGIGDSSITELVSKSSTEIAGCRNSGAARVVLRNSGAGVGVELSGRHSASELLTMTGAENGWENGELARGPRASSLRVPTKSNKRVSFKKKNASKAGQPNSNNNHLTVDDPNERVRQMYLEEMKNRARAKKKRRRQEELRLTLSFLVVIVCFIICWLPFCVTMFISVFAPFQVPRIPDMLTLMLGCSNSCFNPIIYGVMNRKYRAGFERLYCRWCRPRAGVTTSMENTSGTNT